MELLEYPNWKDTEIEWLKKIPEHWEITKFRHLFKLGRGLGITKKNLVDEGIPCVNYGEIHSRLGFQVIPEQDDLKCVDEEYLNTSPNALLTIGDFVYADTSEDIEGSGNFTHLNSEVPTFAGYHTVTAKPVTDNCTRFLAYLFDSEIFRFQIRKAVTGVKVYSVTQDILKSCYVWLPPVQEQIKISKYLDYKAIQIDELIEKKKVLIDKLEEQRIAMITRSVTKGLNGDVVMKDSKVDWLGEIPAHWEVRKLKYMASIQNGSDYKHVEVEDHNNGYPVYGSGGIFRKASEYLYDGSSVLFGRKGTIDKPLLVHGRFWTVDTMFYSIIERTTDERFLFYSALTIQYQMLATQTALPSITQNDLSNYYLACPNRHEQTEIADHLDICLTKINNMVKVNISAIDKLNEYKKNLITSAVTGQIDVRKLDLPEEL